MAQTTCLASFGLILLIIASCKSIRSSVTPIVHVDMNQ